MRDTFGGYAISQIKKARGLNKKIVNPLPKERKTPIDFCTVVSKEDGFTMSANEWLKKNQKDAAHVGLSHLPVGKQIFKLFYDFQGDLVSENPKFKDLPLLNYSGICNEDNIVLSSIPEYARMEAFLVFNIDGWQSYCKEYKEYWEWVENRNPQRYKDNVESEHNYDGKNMMHCLRLLDMAIEIAEGKGVNLIRPDRDFLLDVRKGKFTYDYIKELAESKVVKMEEAFDKSKLPKKVNQKKVKEILCEIRENH